MTSPYVIQVRKEARALLPWWAGVAVTATAISMLARRNAGFPTFRYDQEIWGVMAYALGILAVAAVSVGHELTHNTLSSLLAQPISRLRVLATKLGVLVPAVITLGILGNWLFVNRYVPAGAAASRALLAWGPVMAGIGLVPLLTVLTRKPLGGVVFSIAIPGLILMIGERFYSLRHGTQALTITWYGTVIVSALGVLVLWHRFTRLEAAGDGGAQTASRAWLSREAASDGAGAEGTRTRPRSRMWLFVKKELRLQQLTLAVSGLYLLACAAVTAAERDPLFVGPTFETLAGLHAFFVAVLAGALSSAEERHLGTLTSEVLLPRVAWRHWSLKVAATAGLACALAFGLPTLLMLILRPANPFIIEDEFVAGISALVCAAMYVSSLCANGLWALLATFPAIAIAAGFGGTIFETLRRGFRVWFPLDWTRVNAVWSAARETGNYAEWSALEAKIRWVYAFERNPPLVLAAGLGLLALYFAGRNHRSLERNSRIILKQVSVMALYASGVALLYFALVRLAWQFVR